MSHYSHFLGIATETVFCNMANSSTKLSKSKEVASGISLLAKIEAILRSSPNLDQVLPALVKMLVLELDLDSCTVLLIDILLENQVTVRAHYDRHSVLDIRKGVSFPLTAHPSLDKVVRTATASLVYDLPPLPGIQRKRYQGQVVTRDTGLLTPLLAQGKVTGALLCQRSCSAPELTAEETLVIHITASLLVSAVEQEKHVFQQMAMRMMAHDLRGPLIAVGQYIRLIVRRKQVDFMSKQWELLGNLMEICDSILGQVNDMLDVARWESDRVFLYKQPTDLPTIIHKSEGIWKQKAIGKGIELELHIDPDIPDIVADERRVLRVLNNLFDNALHFSPSDSKVVLTCGRLDSGEVLTTLTDAGPGILYEHHQRIFDRFYQVGGDGQRWGEGAGLGLRFCHLTVLAHGGRIWVESPVDKQGRGSRFCFTLPTTLT